MRPFKPMSRQGRCSMLPGRSPFTPVGEDLGVDERAAYHEFIEHFDTGIRKEVKDESKIPVKTDRAEPC